MIYAFISTVLVAIAGLIIIVFVVKEQFKRHAKIEELPDKPILACVYEIEAQIQAASTQRELLDAEVEINRFLIKYRLHRRCDIHVNELYKILLVRKSEVIAKVAPGVKTKI